MTTYDAELKNSVAGSKRSADPSVSGETARVHAALLPMPLEDHHRMWRGKSMFARVASVTCLALLLLGSAAKSEEAPRALLAGEAFSQDLRIVPGESQRATPEERRNDESRPRQNGRLNFLIMGGPYDRTNHTCPSGTGMFFFSSDSIRFVMPAYANGPNNSGKGMTSNNNERFTLELSSDDCIYRASVEKLVKINESYQTVPFSTTPITPCSFCGTAADTVATTPLLLDWGAMFENSNDTCFSASGTFFYANDQFRFLMPFYADANKNSGGFLGGPSDRGFFGTVGANCRYLISLEKLVKIDGEYQLVPPRGRRCVKISETTWRTPVVRCVEVR
jgi:hypothetical protein